MESLEDLEQPFSDADEKMDLLHVHDELVHRYNRGLCFRGAGYHIIGPIIYVALAAILVAFSLVILQQSSYPLEIQRSPCGSTASEAQTAGCKFDIISFAWLPPTCYDAELSESFDKLDDWEWFLDENQTQPISKMEALSGHYPILYVTWEYHLIHCTYMWKKMHRAIIGPGKSAIDGYISPYEHTAHCSDMLLGNRALDWKTINTGIRVKYPDCGMI